jgi:hypothetical protein
MLALGWLLGFTQRTSEWKQSSGLRPWTRTNLPWTDLQPVMYMLSSKWDCSRQKIFRICGIFGGVELSLQVGNNANVQSCGRSTKKVLILQRKKLLSLTDAQIRHTVDQKENPTVGSIYQEIRARRRACGSKLRGVRASRQLLADLLEGKEGQLLNIQGLSLRLHQCITNLPELLDLIYLEAYAVQEALGKLPAAWTPSAPDFQLLFKRPFAASGDPAIWLRLKEFALEIADEPLAGWLAFVHPIWISECRKQQGRYEQMVKQADRISRTSAAYGADKVRQAFENELHKVNAKLYKDIIDDCMPDFRMKSPSILVIAVELLRLECGLLSAEAAVSTCLQAVDESPAPDGTQYDLLSVVRFSTLLEGTSIGIRCCKEPLASMQSVMCEGWLGLAIYSSLEELAVERTVRVSPFHESTITRSFIPPHVYGDLDVDVWGLHASYSPGVERVFEEAASLFSTLWPPILSLDPRESERPLSWWDTARRLVHLRLGVSCREMRFGVSPVDPALAPKLDAQQTPNRGGRDTGCHNIIVIECQMLEVNYTIGKVYVQGVGVLLELLPHANLPPLVELPVVRGEVAWEWKCKGSCRAYRIYPSASAGVHEDSEPGKGALNLEADPFALYRSESVELVVSCDILPKTVLPEGDLVSRRTKWNWDRNDVRESSEVDAGARVQTAIDAMQTVTTVMCYGVSIPLYSNWVKQFLGTVSACRVRRTGCLSRGLSQFSNFIHRIKVDSIALNGMNIIAYDTSPSNECLRGLRVSLAERACFSAIVSEESLIPNPFQSGRVVIADSLTRPFRCIHEVWAHLSCWFGLAQLASSWLCVGGGHVQVQLRVSALEARLCTPETGSRGEFLFSVGTLSYFQFIKLPSDLHPLELDMGTEESQASHRRLQDLVALFAIETSEFRRRSSLSPSTSWSPEVRHGGSDDSTSSTVSTSTLSALPFPPALLFLVPR